MPDASTIHADDTQRARRVPLTSPAYRRMLRATFQHKRLIITGIFFSIVYAMLHSVSILAVLPILKVLLEDEGLHGWSDRAMAGAQVDVDFTVHDPADGAHASAALVVERISETSPLYEQGLRAGAAIASLNDEQPLPREWLRRVAAAQPGQSIRFSAAGLASDRPVRAYETVASAPAKYRVGHWFASLIPRDPSGTGRMTALKFVLTALVFVVLAANACRFVGEYLVRLGVLRAMMDLRRELYRRVLQLPMARFTRNTGDMVTRFVQDIQEVQRGLMSLFGKTIREPLKALFILLAALMLDWRITITMIVVAPVAIILFWRAGASIKKANKKLLRGYGGMINALTQTLAAIGVVKAYTTENTERRRLWRVDRGMFRHQVKIIRLEAMMSPLLEVLGVVMVAVVTAWLGARVVGGEIDVAKFGSLVVMLGMMFDPLRKLADVYTRIMRSGAGADRLFELLDAKPESELFAGSQVLTGVEHAIEFRDVTFTYPDADTPALTDINLTVRRGETVALVGRNGSGKTTLVNLLAHFYDAQEGTILFDGIEICDITLRSLRKQIGLVSQQTVVFPVSLAENIAYGSRNGTRETVIDAAKRAHADEFIRQTPDGYDTIPGDMGSTLSGGQRQRLAIARAILRDAPILVFDEATSQIDSESEQKIQTAVREFSKDRTTFIIAHRLSTIRFADRIVVLEDGRIVDTGTHDELITRCPFYHGLCETQLLA